jgi:hypothetical protein
MEHRLFWGGNSSPSNYVVGPLSPHYDMARPQIEAANSPLRVVSSLEYEQGMPTACHREFWSVAKRFKGPRCLTNVYI